jgi:homopolymeric O-antigen transport system ATP-binding protein
VPGPTVIRAESVSKRFEIDDDRHSDATLRDAIAGRTRAVLDSAARTVGREQLPRPSRRTTLWALRDVSFTIDAGDVVGVVGRNGAGKSTLLKILSRITEPSQGRVGLKGRVGSLLEVGTGFHPELTGRENVYLYGSILGMPRLEIRRRFADIVEFAEIGPQLDTPIKRYSSGMQVRLAFAVAAFLEPEILLVDEVLAVGDVAFQKRCLGRMDEVAGEGRTVVFVSHNMALMQALCRRGLFLDRGALRFDGSIEDAVALYLRDLERAMAADVGERTDRKGRQDIRLVRVELAGGADGGGAPTTGGRLSLAFVLSSSSLSTACRFTILDSLGHPVAEFRSAVAAPDDRSSESSRDRFECAIDELPLVPGRYRVDVEVWSGNRLEDALEGAAMFDVEEGVLSGRPIDRTWSKGPVSIRHRWTTPVA